MKCRRILFSAYACEPGKGSEPGVGWRWALETARLGHDVWVITRENNQPGIDRALATEGNPANLHFVYVDLPRWTRWWKRGGHGVIAYYVMWQWGAYRCARKLHAAERFDVVHHITFGVMRYPSFMGGLGIPLVAGPLGGGERAPMALRRHFSLQYYLKDAVRDLANLVAKFDPCVHRMLGQARLILFKTPQSMAWLPNAYRRKAQCALEIGIDAKATIGAELPPRAAGREIRIVYVGRFLYLKGMGLGLQAIAELRALGVPMSLTMIGQGPEWERWRELAAGLGIADCVSWVPWLNHRELLDAYSEFDVLLFPSLHDSSGNVVLEAMANGLPVVCLALGGPAEMVDDSCGRVVPVEGQNEPETVRLLAEAIAEIAQVDGLLHRLRRGALIRARTFEWQRVVARVWGEGGIGHGAVDGEAT